MAKVIGSADLSRALASIADGLEKKVALPALKAGANIIVEEAKLRCSSSQVRDAIGTRGKVEAGVASVTVGTFGEGAYIAPWLEFGTDPHVISTKRKRSLVIDGRFVGRTVNHPGADPKPFLRPAVEAGLDDAVTAMNAEAARLLTAQGLAAPAARDDDDGA